MGDREKRATVAQLLGQAYVTAHLVIEQNREKVEHVADVLTHRRELHGDEVVELLDSVDLAEPKIDLLDEKTWPKL
jgi:ATP-dependent Zn protease